MARLGAVICAVDHLNLTRWLVVDAIIVAMDHLMDKTRYGIFVTNSPTTCGRGASKNS